MLTGERAANHRWTRRVDRCGNRRGRRQRVDGAVAVVGRRLRQGHAVKVQADEANV